MASVLSDIKNNNIAGIYLFYGGESFKKRNYKEQLKAAVTGGNLMNYSEFEGKDINWQAVYDAVVTMPFFAEKRLVVVENSGKFKAQKSDEGEKFHEEKTSSVLEKILQDIPGTTCLAFFEESAAKNRKAYKLAASKGVVCECSADTEEQLINWLARGFAREGKKVRKSTLQLMVERTGTEYDRLRSEFEKVISYAGERNEIEDSDILEITSESVESKVFEMLEAVCSKNVHMVLNKYYDMLANREHPLYILAMLRTHFRTLLQIAELTEAGLSAAETAKKAGKHEW
ncbi:MAG: DNA polymerase III subunit delta, partial [Parasporobacterium sp.]|nr:DNA polymerase III subunit delta [Parasporobacterium sp.]